VSSGDRPPEQSISDGALYFLAGLCGLATGVVLILPAWLALVQLRQLGALALLGLHMAWRAL